MSHEFQYTSAEQTLQPGLKGFGPVVVSRGLPATLQEKLVVLSAYRHLFSGQDPKAKLNPVNYSHLIIPASGKTFHVLSRVADAGLDYSHRTNKFAHHVAVDVSERPPSGPAAILGAAGFMSAKFSGTPQLLDQGRRLPQLEVKPAVCRAWQAVTSDAGWGGVLAETALVENAQPVIVVYRLGLDVLPLVAEAIALLPLEKRWQVTFSTFYQKLPPGVACQWRFMPAEDAETKAAVKALNVKVIDLTRKLDKPVPSPWVEAARTGHRPVPITARGAKVAALALATDKVGGARAGGHAVILGSVQLDSLANDDLFNFDNLPAVTPLLVATPVRRTNWAWMVGLAAGVLIVILAAFLAMQLLRDTPETIAAATSVPPPAIPPRAPVDPMVVAQPNTPPKMTAAVDEPPPSPAPPDSTSPTKSVSVERPPRETTDTTPPPVDQTPVDPFVVLRQVRTQSLGLPLPPAPLDGAVNNDTSEAQWIDLVELPRVDRAKFDLHLTVPPGTTAKFILEPPSAAGPERTWSVMRQTGSPAGDDELGRLRLGGDRLQFAWSRVTPGMQPQQLGRCWLTLINGELRENVRFQSPTPLVDRSVGWNGTSLELPKNLPWNSQHRLLVTLTGYRSLREPSSPLQVMIALGERRSLVAPLVADDSVAIEAGIRASSRAPCTISIDYAMLCTVTGVDGTKSVERHLLKAEDLRAAETRAQRSVDELDAGNSGEMSVWRQRLSQYEIARQWLNSPGPSNLSIRCRLFRRDDLE